MVLPGVLWSIKYLNTELGARHLGCIYFKECRVHGLRVGKRGVGARMEIENLSFIFFAGGRIDQ